MSIQIPKPSSRIIFPLVGYGLVLLIWMSLEDTGTLTVALLGSGAAILFVSAWLWQQMAGQVLALRIWFPGLVVYGGVLGAATTITSTLLMFFKSGWHGHAFPDYPPPMMLAMLQRLPVWMLAGALIGLAVAMIKLAMMEDITHDGL